jgi:uncharacterized membrane protein YraQ (UPF0718 family)/YHS domain-containing protein
VQAFVSREQMQRTMGNHRPPAVLRASGFGMVSSSCSYAATAMARSLFRKGADFVTAMVFMFASTNLVVELGVVLLILLGWQFAVAQFVGGAIMIVLLVLAGAVVFRNVSTTGDDGVDGVSGGGSAAPWSQRLRSKAGWSDAASYAMSDIKMLRTELVIGYVVAGMLAAWVPMRVWNDVFLPGHGVWTSVENVIVGPFIAFISFVCSVGNVPMAAALWHGGISFGGVIAFVFADLIALPLVLIYRKYYGWKVATRLFLTFYAVMALAGLIVEGIFSLAGAVPANRHTEVVTTHFEWNYTTFLNIAFIIVFVVLAVLARNRDRLGGGQLHATDPVCGMQVEKATAPASATRDGVTYWFCSDGCCEHFTADQNAMGSASNP